MICRKTEAVEFPPLYKTFNREPAQDPHDLRNTLNDSVVGMLDVWAPKVPLISFTKRDIAFDTSWLTIETHEASSFLQAAAVLQTPRRIPSEHPTKRMIRELSVDPRTMARTMALTYPPREKNMDPNRRWRNLIETSTPHLALHDPISFLIST